MTEPKKRKLLIIADTPTGETGFGRVAKNLLKCWSEPDWRSGKYLFDEIEVWGIGYTGWPHPTEHRGKPLKIYPAQSYESSIWCTPLNLARLGNLIFKHQYSHVWVMQDLFLLSSKPCLDTLGEALVVGREKWGMESICYFPVDAPVEATWCDFLARVDRPVAYTMYGRGEIMKHSELFPVEVVPHGTDTKVYRPLLRSPLELRRQLFAGVEWHEDDFLIVNVNQNQRRKGLLQTLQVFKRLREMMQFPRMSKRRLKLYMHMRSVNEQEGIDLKVAVRALGLGADVMFGDNAFTGGKALIAEEGLNMIYNAADLLLTTTHGEGWGLSLTEAMAAGCPVAGPRHTSVQEIIGGPSRTCVPSRSGGDDRGILFGTLGETFLTGDNNRMRPLADVDGAALQIANAMAVRANDGTTELSENMVNALQWVQLDEFRWEDVAAKFYGDLDPMFLEGGSQNTALKNRV